MLIIEGLSVSHLKIVKVSNIYSNKSIFSEVDDKATTIIFFFQVILIAFVSLLDFFKHSKAI